VKAGSFSVRARLTLWHAGVLTFFVIVFSLAIFHFVAAKIYLDLDRQLDRTLSAIERVYRADPKELDELESQVGFPFFEVVANGKLVYGTAAWRDAGLGAAEREGIPVARSWTSTDGRPYRVAETTRPSFHIAVALEEKSARQLLWTLAAVLFAAVPCAAAVTLLGGYFLAGRVLSPIGAMVEKARWISAESPTERLPVGNPEDEFGRLASVLNDALSRVHGSFAQLRRFTADASHELRTPLTAIRSVGEVALHKSLDAAAYRDVIGSMLEEVERLTRLVESLLTLTRAESGGMERKRGNVDLSALTADVAGQLRVLAEEKGQNLRVEADAPVFAECDPDMLRQGIMNLLHNAIKYTPREGSIRLSVRATTSTETAIEIRDAGPGISAPHRERIFDRFYRVDEGRSRSDGGAGLGLAIARSSVEANGGRIEVESEPGNGSLFRIVLPTAGN
jgi:heavy metal sensor kinase